MAQALDERVADDEARRALLGLIVRVTDEVRFGVRPLDLDEIESLTRIWRELNDGETPAEVAARVARRR